MGIIKRYEKQSTMGYAHSIIQTDVEEVEEAVLGIVTRGD